MMSYQQFIHVYDHKNNILGTLNSERNQRIQCTNLSKYVVFFGGDQDCICAILLCIIYWSAQYYYTM